MRLRVISVGRKPSRGIQGLMDDYLRRLPRRTQVSWEYIAPLSDRGDANTRQAESDAIRQRLSPGEYVVLLDERGRMLDNNALAELYRQRELAGQMTIVIGGAFGVDDALRQQANIVWSLSPLVLPHQLVWLVLTEQIYRTTTIIAGHPYHHG